MLAAALVGLGCLALTWMAWSVDHADREREVQEYFHYRVRDARARVQDRIRAYQQVLRDTHAHLGTARVDRASFKAFVEAMDVTQTYPGIQGVGYAQAIQPADLARHTAAVRAEGYPDYQVRPPGPRDLYSSILYLEPFSRRNLRAFGFDMFSEPVRRAAMAQARDRAEIAVSGKVTLVQETDQDIQAGFLIYVPLYASRPGQAPPATVAERRSRLRGWVYAPFRMNDFMEGVLGERGRDLDLSIYDGPEPTPEARLYGPGHGGPGDLRESLVLGERSWLLVVRPGAAFSERLGPDRSGIVLGTGAAVSLLLAALTWALVSSRERAVHLAREREGRYTALMRQAHDAILLMTPDGHILEANEQAARHFRRPLEALRGMPVAGLYPAEAGEAVRARLRDVGAQGEARFEANHLRGDGSLVVSDVSVRVVDLEGEKVNFALIQDISEIRQAARELARLSQEQATILESTAFGIAFLRPGRPAWANQRLSTMLGLSVEGMAALAAARFFPSRAAFRRLLREAGPVLARGGTYSAELQLRRGDGQLIWVNLVGRAIQDGASESGSLWTLEDIADRKAMEAIRIRQAQLEAVNQSLEAQVQAAVAEMREKDRMLIQQSRQAAMGEMIGNIAHQWRQPLSTLSVLLGNLGDAWRSGEVDPLEVEATLTRGDLLIQNMSATINDFRNFFRPDKAPVPFSLAHQVRRAADLVLASFEAGHIDLAIEVRSDAWVRGHPNEFSQAFLNLLVNAKQAIQERGRASGRVQVTVDREGAWGVATVQDDGGGIDPAALGRLFEPFFTTRESGSGIGLHMSRQIIEAGMGGRILGENVDGGARFTVRLPLDGEGQ